MAPKVCIVKQENRADYKVCFVDHDHQQKNHQIITGGKLVDHEHQADVKIALVNHTHQAKILITRKNFPK